MNGYTIESDNLRTCGTEATVFRNEDDMVPKTDQRVLPPIGIGVAANEEFKDLMAAKARFHRARDHSLHRLLFCPP